eukprot:TRINITY_DN9518_c0_g1_i1.p1 TRINITY_DN9518_c0_g1~~TRINITY_DN9518_c0_g1_i1.p1  ORF type:complete len:558 (-),score=142.81 TRINITY_DN9518_c0_g1_i1:90-1763(-)
MLQGCKRFVRAFSNKPTLNNRKKYSTTPAGVPEFYIIDSTLREGEQFATTNFSPEDRVYIAKQLDRLGVDYIELVNPVASEQAFLDCQKISSLNLKKAKVLTHVRCHMTDVTAAVKSGVNGVNVYMATSPMLRQYSHGKGIDAVVEAAREVIEYVKRHGKEIRFSCEDAFRSNTNDLLAIYKEIDKIGVDRVGVADTVGIASPDQVYETIKKVRSVISPKTGIEFHTHNDTGCCIANAYMALKGGATHIDTSVLGIGERNGITPLGGFLARMYAVDREYLKQRFDLTVLQHLERYVARASEINIPFNNYVTGSAAFTHKAGVHSKAVMANPNAYEAINPADFGVERHIQFAHRLTGWNAIYNRAKQLQLELSEDQVKAATSLLKNLADEQALTLQQVDEVLMGLAAVPVTSSSRLSTFITQQPENLSPELAAAAKAAADALAAFEKESARNAVLRAAKAIQKEVAPTLNIKVEGHLFDKLVINKIMDLLVESPCKFKITHMEVPHDNEQPSVVYIQISSKQSHDLAIARGKIQQLVEDAGCGLSEAEDDQIKRTSGI